MILQKLASAIRRQDWFQVLIEVLIVIVGIYLGFQVTKWGEDQAIRNEERQILQNLSIDVEEVLLAKLNERDENLEENKEIQGALSIIFNEDSNQRLTNEMCARVSRSAGNNWNYIPLSAADEVVASGKLGLIQNKQLRQQIMRYRSTIEAISNRLDRRQQQAVPIARKYPETILVRRIDDVLSYECFEDKMRSSPEFMNDFTLNTASHSLAAIQTEYEIELLEKLKETLDAEIGEDQLATR